MEQLGNRARILIALGWLYPAVGGYWDLSNPFESSGWLLDYAYEVPEGRWCLEHAHDEYESLNEALNALVRGWPHE